MYERRNNFDLKFLRDQILILIQKKLPENTLIFRPMFVKSWGFVSENGRIFDIEREQALSYQNDVYFNVFKM